MKRGNANARRLKLHPRIAPVKAAILPLVKKDGMPEVRAVDLSHTEKEIQRLLRRKGSSRAAAIAARTKPVLPTASRLMVKPCKTKPLRFATAIRSSRIALRSAKCGCHRRATCLNLALEPSGPIC